MPLTLSATGEPSTPSVGMVFVATDGAMLLGKPGHLIQVYVTSEPRIPVSRPVSNPQVAFVTIYPTKPMHVAGLKQGAKLTFTRVDSYPG